MLIRTFFIALVAISFCASANAKGHYDRYPPKKPNVIYYHSSKPKPYRSPSVTHGKFYYDHRYGLDIRLQLGHRLPPHRHLPLLPAPPKKYHHPAPPPPRGPRPAHLR